MSHHMHHLPLKYIARRTFSISQQNRRHTPITVISHRPNHVFLCKCMYVNSESALIRTKKEAAIMTASEKSNLNLISLL